MHDPPPPPPPMPLIGHSRSPPPQVSSSPAIQTKGTSSIVTKDRGALLTDITKGTNLKKTVTNDRSAPLVEKSTISLSNPSLGVAPPVPAGGPSPSKGRHSLIDGNRIRSNSDSGRPGTDATYNELPTAPQIGGMFAGVGIPKLRKTGGGIDTGRNSSSISDLKSSWMASSKLPFQPSPKPQASNQDALSADSHTAESLRPQLSNPSIAYLGKTPVRMSQRPNSDFPSRSNIASLDRSTTKIPPLPASATKPPPPPVTSRKPSTAMVPVPRLPTAIPPAANPLSPTSTALRPPNPSVPPSASSHATTSRPASPSKTSTLPTTLPSQPKSAPRTPPNRSTPTLAPLHNFSSLNETSISSLAMQAARNAYGSGPSSPALPPPLPPLLSELASSTLPVARQSISINTLAPSSQSLTTKQSAQHPNRSKLEPSSYTLSNGNGNNQYTESGRDNESLCPIESTKIEDSRWRFQDESQLPRPRVFKNEPRMYRAGRGSSVPLNLYRIC